MPTTKVVIFDLDGTLLDTLEDLAAAVNHALAQRGLPQHTTGEYRAMVGHGVRNLVLQALPPAWQADDARVDAALADFKAYYSAHIDVRTRPYPGIPALLARLHARGIALAVASNKFQEGTERLIGKYFPGLPFVAILGNREGFPLKPDPAIVREVLQKAGATPEQAALVGDSRTDMQTAANGGIRGIAVSWGYRTLAPSAEYRLVSSADELERALLTERHPFAPFLPPGARMLFLGSFPPQPRRWSINFFYPNWLNDFWRILGLIRFGDRNHFCLVREKRFDLPAIEAFCREQGLAFFDTATEVIRLKDNASDAFLEVVTPTDIPTLLAQIPACRALITTGEKASALAADAFGCPVPPVGGYVDLLLDEHGRVTAGTPALAGAPAAPGALDADGSAPAGTRPLRFWRMPSTSRAYPLPLEKKAAAYRRLFEEML